MRWIFGIGGLLVTIGIIVLIMKFAILPHTETVLKEGKKARVEAEQMAGVQDGMRTSESITLEPQNNNSGRTVSLLVTNIVAGGPMENYFGLKRNDTVVEINGMPVKDQNDAELAVALALEAYQRKQTLTVVRNGEKVVLPQAQQPGVGAAGTPVATPAGGQQQQQQRQETGGLQGQLDAIQQAGGAR